MLVAGDGPPAALTAAKFSPLHGLHEEGLQLALQPFFCAVT